MTIGLLRLELQIPASRSLKDKRRVLKSLKDRLRSRYNCSVAETEHMNIWARAGVAICVVSGDSAHVHAQLEEIARFAARHHGAELISYSMEML